MHRQASFAHRLGLTVALLLCIGTPFAPLTAGANAPTVRILLVTGGHDYETNALMRMFREMAAVTFKHVEHPGAHALLTPAAAHDYDVIVLYDMWQPTTEQARKDFLSCLGAGKGLVALHHSLGSYQQWPEYTQVIGGRYNLEKRVVNGREIPGSTYKHDVTFEVQVAQRSHPITLGVENFVIHDETYGGLTVDPAVEVLLKTDEPTSHPQIAWAHTYGRARVVYIQLGHDHVAYENPNYQRLVRQAIRWAAPKPGGP